MLTRRVELQLGEWWNERQRVDLAVGMVERDPDLFALVLEDVDVVDLGPRTELSVAIRPDVDQKAHAFGGGLGRGELWLRRVGDDLASCRRPPVRPARA